MRKIIFALAFGVILLPDYGFTLGLGEIEVTTALNQELDAEIELLSAAPEDVETLIVKLASREEFSRAGMDRPYLLNSLKFSAEMNNGVPIIRVTSDKPIREPFLNFLVEIDWPKGHMMREYTILLDPPVFMGQQKSPGDGEQVRPAAMDNPSMAPTTVPDPQGGSGFRSSMVGATTGSVSPAPVPAPAPRAQAVVSQEVSSAPAFSQQTYRAPGDYRIQPGDTLWSLADSLRPDQTVTIEQMMLAMLRSNPEAFINDNINGLKRGYILRIPDRDDIITVNQRDAVDLVREQHALWREYQQTVTPDEPATAMDRESDAGEDAGFDQVGDARLEIVAAGSGVSAAGSKDPTQMNESELRAELAIARESLETERVEKEELQQRVESLEGQVDKMRSLLTLEDRDLAEMQQAATPAEAELMPVEESVDSSVAELQQELAVEEVEPVEEALSELEAVAQDIAEAEEALLEEETLLEEEALLEEEMEQQGVFVEEDMLEAVEETELAEEVIEEPVASSEDFSVEPSTQPAFMQQDQGLLSTLLNNPMLLAAAGGGLLMVLLLIALIMRRRRSGGDDEPVVASNLDAISDDLDEMDTVADTEQEVVADDSATAEAAAMADGAGEDIRETAATEEQPGAEDAAAAATGSGSEESTRDDVIAEADVYLAYGIYQQAEELLQNAIKQNPDNDSYRVKLAETYFAGKNADAFVELAEDMNQRRDGKETAAWKKIMDIGAQLCPEHALFKGVAAGMVDELTMDQLASQELDSEDLDLGEDNDQPALAAAELDLGLDNESDIGLEPEESVEFDLEETGADTFVDEETDGLEFDLDETGAEAAPEETEDSGVEFDLDEAQALDTVNADGTADDKEDEFSLDIEAGELGIADEAAAADGSSDADEEFDLDLSGDADDILVSAEETEEEQAFSLDDVDAASLDLDIDDDTSADSLVAEMAGNDDSAAETELDEAASVLDLDEAVVETVAAPGENEAAAFADSDDEMDLSDLDDIDEVGTKLDLAKAYLDMGDADGTRSILDEVMSEGDDTQKREAEELLRQIG